MLSKRHCCIAIDAFVASLALASTAIAEPVQSAESPSVSATPAPDNSDELVEIVVTAEKRAEPLQRIPLAITAMGGQGLEQRDTTTLAGLSQLVPGLNVSEEVGQARLALRGVGIDNVSTGAESSVAFNQDGVFFSRSAAALASFYDVNRVEVLRGPQGTLYGRNATGGSINIVNNTPTSTLEGGADLTVGNYHTVNADGFISGPMADSVSGRLSFQTQYHDGYGRNLVTGSDIDNKNSQSVRGQILFQPNEGLSVLLGGDYYKSSDRSNAYHYLGAGGETASGATIEPTALALGGFAAGNPRDTASPQNPSAYDEFYGGRVDVSDKVSDTLTVRSLTAYRYSYFKVETDVPPLSIELFPLTKEEKSNEVTQEFQLNVNTERNKFVSGLFYLYEAIDGSDAAPLNLLAVGGPDFFVQGFYGGGRLTTDAGAVYAQDTYRVTQDLHFTIGGRVSDERKSINDQSVFDFTDPFGVPDSLTHTPPGPHQVDHRDFGAFSPKVGVDYDISEDAMIYAAFSEGFKSGTYNLGGDTPAVRPETVHAYEAGLKTTFADRKMRANIAAFYYDYKDLQVGKVENEEVVLENAATAKIYGIEGEFTAKPISPLTLSLNTSWLHARFTEYLTVDQARPGGDGHTIDPGSGLPAFNLAGNTLPYSPNYTVSLAADYLFDLGSGTLDLRGESSWSDRVYFSAFDRDVTSQSAYNIQNAFATYSLRDGHWLASFYIKNVADKTIVSSALVASTVLGSPIIGFLQPPRTFGVTLSYRFH